MCVCDCSVMFMSGNVVRTQVRWCEKGKVQQPGVGFLYISLCVCVRVCIHVCVWSRWLSLSLRTESWCWSYMHTCMHEHTHVNTQSRPDGERVFGGGGDFQTDCLGSCSNIWSEPLRCLNFSIFCFFRKRKSSILKKTHGLLQQFHWILNTNQIPDLVCCFSLPKSSQVK